MSATTSTLSEDPPLNQGAAHRGPAGSRAGSPRGGRCPTCCLAEVDVERLSRRGNGCDPIVAPEPTAVSPEVARRQGITLAGVFQIIISEAGRRAAILGLSIGWLDRGRRL